MVVEDRHSEMKGVKPVNRSRAWRTFSASCGRVAMRKGGGGAPNEWLINRANGRQNYEFMKFLSFSVLAGNENVEIQAAITTNVNFNKEGRKGSWEQRR